jgi:hypothetical protein
MIILVLVGVAALVAIARGGSLARLAQLDLHWFLLLFVPLALQLLIYTPLAERLALPAPAVYVTSMLVAALVVARNARQPGFPVLLAGLLANLAVIAANGGYMPVSEAARAASGLPPIAGSHNNVVPMSDATPLWFLGDLFPIPSVVPLANVFSVGDVLIALGACMFILAASRAPDGARQGTTGEGTTVIYEERRVNVQPGAQFAYLAHYQHALKPALAALGARPIGLLGGMIGDPAESLIEIVEYPDAGILAQARARMPRAPAGIVASAESRLLRAASTRPRSPLPVEDRRRVYGYRRFLVNAENLDEFVRCSAEGVWPLFERQGAAVLGLWVPAGKHDPCEIVLLTGYHSVAHWAATRSGQPKPGGMPDDVWEAGKRMLARRSELSRRSWVCLMKALDLGADEQPVAADQSAPHAG